MTPRGDGAEPEVSETLEIRLHGRGGQGGVTCAKILAAVYASLGKSVQTFGDYAGERSGAPVRAYTRVSDRPVENRNKVYRPHHLLVLDPTLLGDDTVSGLVDGGTLLLNTTEPLESFSGRFERYRLAVVDATAIARRHKIGTRSVVIVNTTIAGAFVHALDLPIKALEDTYHHLRLDSNFAAAREAYESVKVRPARKSDTKTPHATIPAPPAVLPLVDHFEGRPTGLRTGSWRTQLPRYVKSLAPCNAFCPAGNDVIQFVQALTKDGGVQAGAEILGRSTPLAATCGRVCPAPCMEGCNRREHDGAVNIRGLERYIADRAPVAVKKVERHKDVRRIAIIGGGPAGISAAYEIARAGHEATIFDGEKSLGGVLRTGIPTYRLPRDVLDKEIDAVLALGVKTKLGEFLDTERLATIAREYDALIVATGLQKLRGLDGTEKDTLGVEQGIHFLHRINLPVEASIAKVSGHVVVLGGGNTAMDCARSALRAGASRVTVAYRRSRAEMPAIAEEIEEAEHEGIAMLYLRAPIGFERGDDKRVKKVVLAEVDLGPPDDTGRRAPVVSDRKVTLECDRVLLALGQSADTSLLPRGWVLREGRIFGNDTKLLAFAAGDLATGDGTVTHAIGDGRRAATRAMRALGVDINEFVRPDRNKAVAPTDVRLDHFPKAAPDRERFVPVGERVKHFDEVSAGLETALESNRCFSCGECTHCDTCLVYCPEGIIHRKGPDYEVDLEFCKGCGICVVECPRKAMEMVRS